MPETEPNVPRTAAEGLVPPGAPELPGSAAVMCRLLRLARSGQVPQDRLAELIKGDPAQTVRVLHAANAAELGQRAPVVTVERAVALLGTEAVLALTLSTPLDPALAPGGRHAAAYDQWWRRAIVRAVAVCLLGGGTQETTSEWYAAGLLSELECLLDWAGGETSPASPESREPGGPQAGGRRVAAWMSQHDLPRVLADAAELRDAPLHQLAEQGVAPLVPALAVAGRVGEYLCGEPAEEQWAALRTVFTSVYRRSADELTALLGSIKARAAVLQSRLGIDPDRVPPLPALAGGAAAELGRLALAQSLARTQAQIESESLRAELARVSEQVLTLQRQALRDPLTGVFNRQFFEESLDKEIRRCCRYASPIGLIFVDVDGFKLLNDSYGHQFGDQVLRRVAASMADVLRGSDVMARYGGEEFVVLPNGPSESGVLLLAERLRERVEREEVRFEGEPVRISISVGCTISLPGRHEPDLGARLVATADAAMYEAKRQGRNRVCMRSLVSEGEARLMQRVVRSTFSRWLVRRGILDNAVAALALLRYEPDRTPLGELALRHELLAPEQVQRILEEQHRGGDRFGTTAARLALLSEDQLVCLLALQREDPAQVARILTGQGLLPQHDAELLLGEYLRMLDGQFAGGAAPESPHVASGS